MKRIATMQDISCIGKCSLTAALPVLSSMGVECAVLPTAVLSTHTMFRNFSFIDLTQELIPILDHWQKEGFRFDALYTGYLGSFEQMKIAEELFDRWPDALVLIDPCMADNGRLYTGFTDSFVQGMAKLCARADYICPNLTEACLLLNLPYKENFSKEEICSILKQLTDLGAKNAILTGVCFEDGCTGACSFSRNTNRFTFVSAPKQPQNFHGTGDLWASCFLGSLMQGKELEEAMQIACDFISSSISFTLKDKDHRTYGVNFEEALPMLSKNA